MCMGCGNNSRAKAVSWSGLVFLIEQNSISLHCHSLIDLVFVNLNLEHTFQNSMVMNGSSGCNYGGEWLMILFNSHA